MNKRTVLHPRRAHSPKKLQRRHQPQPCWERKACCSPPHEAEEAPLQRCELLKGAWSAWHPWLPTHPQSAPSAAASQSRREFHTPPTGCIPGMPWSLLGSRPGLRGAGGAQSGWLLISCCVAVECQEARRQGGAGGAGTGTSAGSS